MNCTTPITTHKQVIFDIIGFDRRQFVSDVLAAAAGMGATHIAQASFEADGLRSTGWLTVQGADHRQLQQIDQRLQGVRGLVRVSQRIQA